MATFKVTYGVGGGYNDITTEVLKFNTIEEAEQYAYECSEDVFNIYGIFRESEEEYTEDEYGELYYESLERWVTYSAVEVPESSVEMCQ